MAHGCSHIHKPKRSSTAIARCADQQRSKGSLLRHRSQPKLRKVADMSAEYSSSFVQLPSQILVDPEITALDLRIYAILMDFGRKSRGFSQIGHQHLAKLTGTHPRTVGQSLKRLTMTGYVTVERIGLNRNDKIRCQKTVSRTGSKPTLKNVTPAALPHLIDIKKKRDRTSPPGLDKPSPAAKPSQASPDTARQVITTEAIQRHSGKTNTLLNQLRQDLRPQSMKAWFEDINIVSEDDDQVEIYTPKGRYAADWISDNYIGKLTKMAGKDVKIVCD